MRTLIALAVILLSTTAFGQSYPTIAPKPLAADTLPEYPVIEPIPAEQSPTPIVEVRRILTRLNPRASEVFVDYGCGDGRWLIEAARTYGCRCVGVELDPRQVRRARRAIAAAGLTGRVRVIEGDVTLVDVPEAQVGVAYLYSDVLVKIKPKLLKLNRFATYRHRVTGVVMQQDGDSWIWQRATPLYSTGYAEYGGQYYSGRVCNSPYCSMCNQIQRQLGQ